jgi:glycine cleavage system H lipoate-binding protein
MSCPFLKEGRARYCLAAPFRKLILEGPGSSGPERCASPAFRSCALVRNDEKKAQRCPHLEEILVQYCGASLVTKLVPFSDSQLSRCTAGYRYCDSYLSVAHPGGHAAAAGPNLFYSSNHFWLEPDESNLCHIGIDAFLANLVVHVDGITFVTTHGTHRPSVVLAISGVDWPLTFPNSLLIEKVNNHLRADPKRLTADPYGVGWLFEGWELPGKTRAAMIAGPQAAAWQQEERERLAREIHQTQELACDGGYAQPGVARMLPREAMVGLFQRFFSKNDWSRED